MTTTCFDVEIDHAIAHIRLNRGEELNTMIPAFWQELPVLVRRIDEDAEARIIVLSSTGRHFTAGMDLAAFGQSGALLSGEGDRADMTRGQRREAFRHFVRTLQDSFTCLETARLPVLAAIQGGCIGAGVDMVSAADIRYCTKDAFFCIQEIELAMTADVGTFPRLCRLIPDGWVRELAYTGRRLPADKAKELGLVNEVYDTHEEMMTAVMAVAADIAAKAPLAVTGSKRMITYAHDHTTADCLDYVATWQAGMFQPADIMESLAAKGEKRPPRYQDLLPLKAKL